MEQLLQELWAASGNNLHFFGVSVFTNPYTEELNCLLCDVS